MLTGAAWNALLKTLEEPPKHAVIVLATTEYEKLPPTITSRAQRFVFKKIPKTIIMGKLATEAKAEKIKIDEPALELIAAIAEGSVRDAESLLDQIASLGGRHRRSRTSNASPAAPASKKIAEFAGIIIAKDLPAALAHLGRLNEEGGNPVQFTKDLIHYLRKVLSLKLNPELEKMFERELTKEEVAVVKKMGAVADVAFLVTLEKALIRAYSEMRYSPFAAYTARDSAHRKSETIKIISHDATKTEKRKAFHRLAHCRPRRRSCHSVIPFGAAIRDPTARIGPECARIMARECFQKPPPPHRKRHGCYPHLDDLRLRGQLFDLPPEYLKNQLAISDPNYPKLTISKFSKDITQSASGTLEEVQNAVGRYLGRPTHQRRALSST